jgi:signal transduction histidine kinase
MPVAPLLAYLSRVASRLFHSWVPRLSAWSADLALALACAVALVGVRVLEAHGVGRAGWLGYALTALAAAALAARRSRPLMAFAATLALSASAVAFASPTGAISVSVVIAVYTLARLEARRRATLLAVLAGVSLTLARGLFQFRGWSDARTAVEPVLVLAALFLGWAVSSRRAYIAEIEARAAEAERTREEEAARQVDAERLRIARELHDVLAHGIATINVQAGVAAHVLNDHPERAAEALRTIKSTSREALRELRGILGVLRTTDEVDPREPSPGLGQLERLISATSAAGCPTRLAISGDRQPLPATVDLTAYRILQESLTNVLRHAGETSAVVSISYNADVVAISVEDGGGGHVGSPTAPTGLGAGATGHGILGMRERAHALGGELQAGPRAGGGFRVSARLPISGRS